jgi:cyclophilin family peptidyl-prolyl cis-trans isomerase
LLAASLAPIADLLVPSGSGYQLPLDGGDGRPQTFTVSSSNPRIGAAVTQGQFLIIGVSHEAANENDLTFSDTLTFQLFEDLTPIAASRIEELVNQGFYLQPTSGATPVFPSKNWHRIAGNFPGPDDFIVQGGSVNGQGSGEVNQAGFPFPDEFLPQLAFTGQYQLAMANAGPNTNSSQFFVTTGSPRFLDNRHTIFGQLVDGEETVQRMIDVARNGETPINPILFTSTTLSPTNPDGVIHIDTTQAQPGDSATLTVTATDPADGSQVTRTVEIYIPGDTGAVRVLNDVMLVTPPARRGRQANTIEIQQSGNQVYAVVNGVADQTQLDGDLGRRIVVYGTKARDRIRVDSSVRVPATLDGGHGGFNRIQAGGEPSRLHGWFGFNTLRGGPRRDALVGRMGRVRFLPSPGRDFLFTGDRRPFLTYKHHAAIPPSGMVFHFVGDRIVPGRRPNVG